MINTNKLKGKIVESGYNMKSFAKAIGMSFPTFSGKLHGSSYFDTRQVGKITTLLGIPLCEIPDYFFAKEDDKMPTKEAHYAE